MEPGTFGLGLKMMYCKKCKKLSCLCKCDLKLFQDYVRVTEILKRYSDLSEVDPVILKNAGDRGTDVHRALDAYIEGLATKVSNESYKPYIQSALNFISTKNFIAKPSRFFDDDLQITGECDAIYKQGHDLVLVDFKTSARESKTWILQGSAYAYLARKSGYNITRIEFVHLKKTGKPAKILSYEEDFSTFLKCLEIYRFFEKNPERANAPDELV